MTGPALSNHLAVGPRRMPARPMVAVPPAGRLGEPDCTESDAARSLRTRFEPDGEADEGAP